MSIPRSPADQQAAQEAAQPQKAPPRRTRADQTLSVLGMGGTLIILLYALVITGLCIDMTQANLSLDVWLPALLPAGVWWSAHLHLLLALLGDLTSSDPAGKDLMKWSVMIFPLLGATPLAAALTLASTWLRAPEARRLKGDLALCAAFVLVGTQVLELQHEGPRGQLALGALCLPPLCTAARLALMKRAQNLKDHSARSTQETP